MPAESASSWLAYVNVTVNLLLQAGMLALIAYAGYRVVRFLRK
jgi:hypothetical protein